MILLTAHGSVRRPAVPLLAAIMVCANPATSRADLPNVSLGALALAYQHDDSAADAHLKGKRITITDSQIESVQTAYLGLVVTGVARIRAALDDTGKKEAEGLRPGQTVRLSCVIDGTGFYAVEMSQCHTATDTTKATPYPLRAYQNTADMECEEGQQCSDSEFAGALAEIQAKWPITPDWVKSRCYTAPTLPTLTKCIIQTSVSSLNPDPNSPLNWLPNGQTP
jgi:hypothetical protein